MHSNLAKNFNHTFEHKQPWPKSAKFGSRSWVILRYKSTNAGVKGKLSWDCLAMSLFSQIWPMVQSKAAYEACVNLAVHRS